MSLRLVTSYCCCQCLDVLAMSHMHLVFVHSCPSGWSLLTAAVSFRCPPQFVWDNSTSGSLFNCYETGEACFFVASPVVIHSWWQFVEIWSVAMAMMSRHDTISINNSHHYSLRLFCAFLCAFSTNLKFLGPMDIFIYTEFSDSIKMEKYSHIQFKYHQWVTRTRARSHLQFFQTSFWPWNR